MLRGGNLIAGRNGVDAGSEINRRQSTALFQEHQHLTLDATQPTAHRRLRGSL
jgi:hypothetical protein